MAIGPVIVPDGVAARARTTTRASTRTRSAAPTRPPARAMIAEIDDVRKNGDTLGGVIEVVVHGLPPGLGSHVHWDRRLDSRLAGALMGVQSVKAVEVGDGLETARRRGSVAHDEIELDPTAGWQRRTDRAGGIEGGMTNGEVLRVRAAMKPISTVPRALATVDTATRRARRRDQPAQRRLRGAARQRRHGGDGRAGARRRRAGEVRRRLGGRDPPQRARPTSTRSRSDERPAARARRAAGVGQDHRRDGGRRAARRAVSATPTRRRGGRRHAVADVFVEHGEPHFRALEEQAVAARRWPSTRASSPSAAER